MPGRRPKPTALHKLHGTYHATKHGRDRKGEPQPEGDLYAAPPGLTAAQRVNWRYAIHHSPPHLLKKLDRGVLKIWVISEDRLDTANRMQALLDEDNKLKLLIKGPLGLLASPYEDIIDRAAKRMFRCAQELGFSPASRPRIRTDAAGTAAAEAENPWAQFKVIPGGLD
jgi:hypothetical protein